jgi:hypothetical protein
MDQSVRSADLPLPIERSMVDGKLSDHNVSLQEFLTAEEVAADSRCSKAQVYRLINGEVAGLRPIPSLSLGRKKVVRRCSFEAWKHATENHAIVAGESELNAVDALK